MESGTDQETFGSYLKGFRVKHDLAIKRVAEKTKITVYCLKAIEENAHDRLPPRAYVRSFIRTFADAVGANADVAVALYLSDLEQQEIAEQLKLRRRKKVLAVRRATIAGVVIATILLLLRYTDFFLNPLPSQRTAAPEQPVLPAPDSTSAETNENRLTAAKATSPDKLKLQVTAVEQTWLKVIVDGQNARTYNLKPEERLELEGTNDFNLMIGNATGLQIVLNDRPVKIYGSSGQVVSLKIP